MPQAGVLSAVRWFWPADLFSVPPEHRVPSFSGGRCPIIGSYQLPAVKYVSKVFHRPDEFLIIFSLSFWDRIPLFIQRSPLLYFFHVLHQDHIRQDFLGMLVHRPRKDPQTELPRFSSLGLTMTRTVRTCPHQRHMLILDVFPQIDLEDVFRQMQRIRMIRLVHQNSVRVVIDRNVYRPPQCHLNANGSTAPAGKTIYNQIFHFFRSPVYPCPGRRLAPFCLFHTTPILTLSRASRTTLPFAWFNFSSRCNCIQHSILCFDQLVTA